MKFYYIDEDQLRKLKAIATRLYSERRMNGDEMRDAAHLISAIVRVAEQIPAPT